MTRSRDNERRLSRLVGLAAKAPPPGTTSTGAGRSIRQAMLASSTRREAEAGRRGFRRAVLLLTGAATLAAALLWWWRPSALSAPFAPPPRSPAPAAMQQPATPTPLRMRLPTGEALVATPGTELDFERGDDAERRIALSRGAAVFAVGELSAGEAFVVTTRHAKLRVRGTVFSVEVSDARTAVRVYEGGLAVQEPEREEPRLVAAGQTYASDGEKLRADADPLRREALELVAARSVGAALPAEPARLRPQRGAAEPAASEAGPGRRPR